MILLIRFLPVIASLLTGFLFWYQRTQPFLYPWIVLSAVALAPMAALVIARGKLRLIDLMEKMLPTFLLVASLAFAFMLVEGVWQFWILIALTTVSVFISLELLFLLVYNPRAYPVNGLSHINVAYVPLIIWYAFSTSCGLVVFFHIARWWHLALAASVGAALFRFTGHPGATQRQHVVWALIGALTGAEIGWIGLLLPVSFGMQGFIAALILTSALRARRYLYDPKPPRRLAWGEGIAGSALLLVSLATAKWV